MKNDDMLKRTYDDKTRVHEETKKQEKHLIRLPRTKRESFYWVSLRDNGNKLCLCFSRLL